MADIFDIVEPKKDIFDKIRPTDQISVERPAEAKLRRFRGAPVGMTYPYSGTFGTPDVGKLAARGLKQIVNIPSNIVKKIFSPEGIPNKLIMKYVSWNVSRNLKKEGITVSPKEIQADIIAKHREIQSKIPALSIAPPEGTGEKIVDIGANIGQFVTELAVLKKVAPVGTSGAALWEMQNLVSGGTPGTGALMYGAFTAPGKIIKGVTLPAKAGRLVAESVALASVSALEQKIDTGEIDPVQVGIAAALPVALRTPKVIKGLIRKRSPKIVKAIAATRVRKYTPEEAKHYKVLSEGIKDDRIVNLLLTKYPKLFDIPAEIKFSTSKPVKGWFSLDKNTVYINPTYNTNPTQMAKTLVHEIIHAHQAARGKYGKLWAEVVEKYNLHGKTKKQAADWLRKLGQEKIEEYAKLPTEEMAYRAEALIFQKIRALKPVTIDTTNKAVTDWSKKAQLLNKTERKAAVHLLRQQQHARYTSKYKAERAKGVGSFEAAKRAKRVRGGKAGTPEIEPLVLSNAQRELYGRRIEMVYPEHKGFQRGGAFDAITKMENGKIPTNYEFGLLEPVLGTETTTKLFGALKGKKKLESWDIPTLIRDIPKALRFGFDPQAARGLSKMTIRHPLIYLSTLGKNIRGIFSKKYADRVSKAIETSPAYELGKKSYGTNYLSMKPWASVEAGTKLEQYGRVSEIFLRSKSRIIRGIGVWLRASERGANLGMNSALNKLVIKGEKDLARYSRNKNISEEGMAAWRKRRGHDINIFTKRITAKNPKGKAIQRAANWLVFSPSYTASGLASGPQSFIKLATGKGFADKTYAMQIMLSRLAGLVAVSSAVGYAGHKYRLRNPTEEPVIDSSPNPIDPLFGKIRYGEDVYDLGFGDVADYRLMARIGLSAYMTTRELVTGKQVTTIGGKKPPTAGEAFGRYLESKRTLYLSLAKQLLSGKDWLGNPVDLKDTALDNLPFEFFQAFVEAGEADGLWEEMANGIEMDAAKKTLGNLGPAIAALGGVGTGSYPVHAATTRYKFQDIIAEQKHGKTWDKLSSREQNRLKSEHRKQFEVLSERVRKERVDVPFSMERIQKEEREANKRVSKMLSKESKVLVKDIDLGVSRRPKNWYLNDKRYNRYQELVAQFVDERLSRIDFTGMEEKRRIARVQIIVKVAKNKALATLRREIKR